MHEELTLSGCHSFWRNPPENNLPAKYAGRKSSPVVVEFAERHIQKGGFILELGCNAGVSLAALWDTGYRNLMGVEINPEAIMLAGRRRPDIEVAMYAGSIEGFFSDNHVPVYDLIFAKAVLCHLHPDSEWVFECIAASAHHVLTIEDEVSYKSGRHFPRNYRKVFEGLGMKQIDRLDEVPHMNQAYTARMFKNG